MSNSVLDTLGRVIGTCPACDGAGEIDDGSDWGRKGCDRCFLLRELREALAEIRFIRHEPDAPVCLECEAANGTLDRLAALLSGAPSREDE